MMTANHKWLLLVGVLALLFLAEWHRSHELLATTKVQVKADEQTVAAAAQHIVQTDAGDRTFRKQIQSRQAQLTAQSALAELQAHIPAAQIATDQAVTTAELPEEMRDKLPASPGYLCLSDPQLKAIASDQLGYDADRHSLAARESDVTDLHTQLAARTAEAAAWERAAKGGSKWQRFGRVLKITGCAAAGAGAGALIARQDPAGAAIGGAGGVVACSLF